MRKVFNHEMKFSKANFNECTQITRNEVRQSQFLIPLIL